MSMRDYKTKMIWNNVTPVAISSSTNANPSVITTGSAHGLLTGQRVMIFNHATNTAINGIFEVVFISATTFSLKDVSTGLSIAGNGVGGATGYCLIAPDVSLGLDWTTVEFQVSMIGVGATTMTIQIAGSLGKPDSAVASVGSASNDTPNFGAAVTASNPYESLALLSLLDESAIAGGTGISAAAADITSKTYRLRTPGIKYYAPILTSWTQGAITLRAVTYNNQ